MLMSKYHYNLEVIMKRGMRTKVLALVCILALATTGLFAQGASESKKVRIGFAAHSIELGALFGQLREGFVETLNEAGLDFELIQGAPANSGDHGGMLQILENMATLGLDYVVVGPTSLELNEPGLMAIAQSGAKLIMTDYVPPEEGVPYDDAVLTWVVYSHHEMGYKAGKWLMDTFKAEGVSNPRVVMLWGPAASEISQQRGQGVLDAFDDSGLSYSIVYEAYADFRRDLAYTEAERAIAAYDFDAIVGLNSYTAVSAMEAAKANNVLDKVKVVGMGGIVDELQAIAVGEIGAAPFRDPRSMGRLAAEALLAHWEGRPEEIIPISYCDMPVVHDVDTIRQYVPKEMFDVDAFMATQN